MEEKDNYSPAEVAQICEDYIRIFSEEIEKYREFVPKKVQEAITNLRETIEKFYREGRNPEQKDSLNDLEARVKSCRDFEGHLKFYGFTF